MSIARLLRPRLSDWQRRQRPPHGATVLFLIAVLVSSSSSQTVPGNSDITIISQPEDIYTITGNIAMFECRAQREDPATGSTEYLDMIVYFNGEPIDRFQPPPRMFVIQKFQKVAGLAINPTELQDNNASLYCEVENSGGLLSQTAILIVADGKPPAVVPTQVSQGLYDIGVMWEPVLVPKEGPLLNYMATLMGPVNQGKELGPDVTSLLLEGLHPASQYSLTVVASNSFGTGNVTSVTVTTKNPIVPTAPEYASVNLLPANSALVTWKAVSINNQTMTPILHYHVAYFPVQNPSLLVTKSTVDANDLQMMLYNLTIGETYEIKVSAVNSAGQGESFNVTVVIALPASTPPSTQAAPTSATPTQSFTQSAPFSSLSSSLTLTTASTSSILPNLPSTSTSSTSSTVIIDTSLGLPSTPATISSSTQSTGTSSTISTGISSSSPNIFSTSSTHTSTSSPVHTPVDFPDTSSTSSKIISPTRSSTHSIAATFTNSVHSLSIFYSASSLPSSSPVPSLNSQSHSTLTPIPSSSNEAETPSTSSTDSSATSPSGSGLLLIIVPAIIAGLVVIAIVIIATMIIVMCLLSIRKDSQDIIDGEIPSNSPWENQQHSSRKRKEKEHEASLKDSYSGSTDRSFGSSDSSEMPTLAIHHTRSSAANGNYYGSIPDDSGTTV